MALGGGIGLNGAGAWGGRPCREGAGETGNVEAENVEAENVDAGHVDAANVDARSADSGPSVDISPQGWHFEARAGLTILTSARLAGVVLPSSCRNGTCRTCRCRLLSGRVRYIVTWPGLSAEEKVDGWILPCVAVAESALVIDAPRALDLRPLP